MTAADVAVPMPPARGLPPFLRDGLAYGLVSLVALVCDYGLLVGLVSLKVPYLTASFFSFVLGASVAYALSVRFVFATRRAASRTHEILGFFAVGVAGLVLTQVLLYLLVTRCGVPVALAKVPVVGLVFCFNFVGRRTLVFVGHAGASTG
jgi:putative flippase GtrA